MLIEIDGQEHIVLLEIEGRGFAGAEEVGDVFHLDEGHGGLFELDARGSDSEVDEPMLSRGQRMRT